MAVPGLNPATGTLRPVKGNSDLLKLTASGADRRLFYVKDEGGFEICAREVETPLNIAVAAGGRCYFMVSGQQNAWEASARWGMFDAATGDMVRLGDAPEDLTDFALCATEDRLFAARGRQAYLGHFDEINHGVALGVAFEGLSVSATRQVFLVNDCETIAVAAGTWHRALGDYLICSAGDEEVFGQIVNR